MEKVKVYGADWCGPTRRTLMHLDELGVEYEYIDVDHDEAASQWVRIRRTEGEETHSRYQWRDSNFAGHEGLEEALRAQKALV